MDPGDLESGLICGFASDSPGRLRQLAWRQMDDALAAAPTAPVWLHFNVADRRSQHFITHCQALPQAAREFLLEHDARGRFEPIEGAIGAVLVDLRLGLDDPGETGALRLWCTERVMVTTRSVPLATIDRLRTTIRSPSPERGALDFLIALLRLFQITFGERISELDRQFTRVEDAILAEQFTEQGGELGRLRRRMVYLRRLVNPQHHTLHGLATRPPAWVDRSSHEALQDLSETVAAALVEIDHLQEGARLLQDEQASRQAEVTNRNLYFLAIVTAIFLPMTLVAGIFGMNVAGMPGLMTDGAFWWVVVGLAITGAGSLILLRWRGLI